MFPGACGRARFRKKNFACGGKSVESFLGCTSFSTFFFFTLISYFTLAAAAVAVCGGREWRKKLKIVWRQTLRCSLRKRCILGKKKWKDKFMDGLEWARAGGRKNCRMIDFGDTLSCRGG